MTVGNKNWTLVETGYYMLDLGQTVLYVVKTASGWVWERLFRDSNGELCDDNNRNGNAKRRHHAATSALRSLATVAVDYCWLNVWLFDVEFTTTSGYRGAVVVESDHPYVVPTVNVLDTLRNYGFRSVQDFTVTANNGETVASWWNPACTF